VLHNVYEYLSLDSSFGPIEQVGVESILICDFIQKKIIYEIAIVSSIRC
jgi:hypothetical protein